MLGYRSLGCYSEASSGRALPNYVATPGNSTIAGCIAACKAKYRYIGMEYGRECWCGNTLGAIGSVSVPSTDCNMPCVDNATEYCGAGMRLNLYQPDDPPAPVIKYTVLSGSGKNAQVWNHQGCWTEPTVGRALSSLMYASDYMTLETCASFCNGYGLFGIEYRRECKFFFFFSFLRFARSTGFARGPRSSFADTHRAGYCGNDIQPGSFNSTTQADCYMTCMGDNSEYCGGNWRLQMYARSDFAMPVPAISSTTTSSSTSIVVATTSSTSTSSSTTSTSSTPTSTSSSTSTTSTSTRTSTSTSTTSAPSSSSSSSSSSSASSSSTTLAGPLPAATVNPGISPYSYYGCVAEPSKGRLLTQVAGGRADMSVALCNSLCPGKAFVGVQYAKECWCGASLNWNGDGSKGYPGVTPGRNATAVECSTRCAGNPYELCGAGLRMNLYYLDPAKM